MNEFFYNYFGPKIKNHIIFYIWHSFNLLILIKRKCQPIFCYDYNLPDSKHYSLVKDTVLISFYPCFL